MEDLQENENILGEAEPKDRDLVLLRKAATGDFAAFETLVNGYQSRVYSIALRIVGQQQDAEDVTQMTFLSVMEHMDTFRGDASVATWIFRIATNHALKILRKKRGLPVVSIYAGAPDANDSYGSLPHPDYVAQWHSSPQELLENAETREFIEQALLEVDEKYRVIFLLRDVEGFSTREAAQMLDITESTAKVRLLRARLQLREKLTRFFGDETTRVIPDHNHE